MAQDTELGGHVLGGKFRLVRRVEASGAGGSRPVYEARHERLARRFAVELWPATTPWDAFRRGAELAVSLRHPGVVQVLDFNCEPGAPAFLAMEWLDGTRLSDLLAQNGPLPVARVATLVESAAWALASAHQQGVVHEELRPDCIFVVQAAGTAREWTKLTGFGVAAALRRAGAVAASAYRAPEQDQPDQDDGADPQSDQYALAAIAYEMLTGVPPFDESRSTQEPPPLSDLAPDVSPAVDAAIAQALKADPEQRFADILEFARALRDAAEGATADAVRKRAGVSSGGGRRARRGAELSVSPFFNPLQDGATRALRSLTSTTARLKTLAGAGVLPRPYLRIAVAGGALTLAFAGAAMWTRHLPWPRHASRTTPPPAVTDRPAAPRPGAPAPGAPPVAAPETGAAAAPVEPPADDPGPPTRRASPAAWAKLAAGNPERPSGVAARHAPGPTPRPAAPAAKAAAPAAAAAAPTAASGGGGCLITVGSRPVAEVWIDEHSLGRSTPLVGYHLPCGDHKLVLKRGDLDLYQMEMITLTTGKPFKKVYPLE